MNDVRFLGGHGTNNLDGTRANPYNNNRTADPDANRRWDGQYPSLWVTDGGGGTFFDIWTPSTFALAGMLVSDTSTEGRIYADVERAPRALRGAVPQRRPTGGSTRSRPRRSAARAASRCRSRSTTRSDITFANFHLYRVISSYQPFPWAVKVIELEEHPVPELPLLQQQQGRVRRRGVRPDARRRDPAARVRVADAFGSAARAEAGASRRPCSRPARRCRSWPAVSSTSRAARSTRRRLLLRGRALAAHLPLVRPRPASSRRCTTRRSIRSTWRSTRRAT